MTYAYDKYVEKYGISSKRKVYPLGTFITPNGELFDLGTYASTAHNGGYVYPFLRKYLDPTEKEIMFYSKDEILNMLYDWKSVLPHMNADVPKKALKARYDLVLYLINIYKSSHTKFDYENECVDLSYASGLNLDYRENLTEDRHLKDILIRACNWDAIESQRYRVITTSKFHIYEIFYDYFLHGYTIDQIPKLVYDLTEERYIEYKQNPFFLSDKEQRLKEELESICRNYSLEERSQFVRQKKIPNRYEFID